MDNWPKVAIIILNWNGWRDTIECLESLQRITYPNYQIIVVDNGSTDNSVEQIKDWIEDWLAFHTPKLMPHAEDSQCKADTRVLAFDWNVVIATPKLVLIVAKENLGFCGGNNLGIKYALSGPCPADFVFLLNNDTVVQPNLLESMVSSMEKESDVGIASCKIYYFDKPEIIWYVKGAIKLYPGQTYPHRGERDDGRFRGIYETEWCSGCAMMIRRQVFETIGFFDESFFIWSEEVDFSLRARKAGYRLIVNADSSILHKEYQSLRRGSPGTIYYATRNRMLLAYKYWGRFSFLAFMIIFLLVRLVRTIQWFIQGNIPLILATWEAVVDFFTGRYGKWRRHDIVYNIKRLRELT